MWKSLKRWPFLLALVVVLVVIGGLAVGLVCLPYRNRVTLANCERIKEGMTEAEVRAILGKPFDDSLFDPDPPSEGDLFARAFEAAPEESCSLWMGNSVRLYVVFDDGLVLSTTIYADPEVPHSWLPVRVWRRLRARYGW
jgi:hypothetical protein